MRDPRGAAFRQAEAAPQKLYEIAGRLLRVEADAEWASRFAEGYLSGLHLTASPHGDEHSPDQTIQIGAGPRPAIPSGMYVFEVPGGFCHAGGGGYFVDLGYALVTVRGGDDKTVSVWVEGGVGARALITVMAYAVPAALRRCGLFDLHAAGMVEPSGERGFIFPGKSGSGKTTLAMRLGAAGWRYLSDDMVLVSGGAGGLEVRGMRRLFQASAETLAGHELPLLREALGITVPSSPDKRCVDPATLFPGQFNSSASPRVLCFAEVTRSPESRIEPIGKAEAMSRLLALCPWARYDVVAAREHLEVLSGLARQCETWALSAGRDLLSDPLKASNMLMAHGRS
ncbi:MAG TPA: hypothetical protein VF668_02925 [Pyrinomonadaceae bacterium]|jgi:hypothetical protein